MSTLNGNEKDNVNHPDHYGANENGIECIEVTECMNFNLGNAVKYIWRAGRKGDGVDCQIEDLEKARKYLEFEIDRIERAEERRKKSEGLKSGYVYVAPIGSESSREWVSLGYTDEGFSETFSFPREASMTFKLDEVSRENIARAFGSGQFRSEGVKVNKYSDGVPNVVFVSENGCCSQAFYSEGKHHSVSCNVQKVKDIADQHRPRPIKDNPQG